jgi:tetratricopeptide (TPR) repeat protein
MQSLSQNRTFNRVIMFALIAALMIIVSWRLAPAHSSAQFFSFVNGFAYDAASRASTSLDTQIQSLQSQLRSHPDDWQSYSQLGLAYLQKARETGDPTYYQKTEEALNKALSYQPDDYVSVGASGALALARHQFRSALEFGEQARQINPDRAYAYGVIADAQIELGQYSEAVETLQTMVNLRPDMSSYSRISYIRELNGDSEGALDMMQRAVDSGLPNAENTAWSRTQLATLYFNIGDLKQAESEYQRTLQDRPNYVYAIAGLGRVRAAQGKTDEAIKLLNEAIAIMPMPDFVITLGDLYQTTGQHNLAAQQYKLVAAIEKLYRANGVDLDMEIALFNADHDQNLTETLVLARKAYENRTSIQGADALAWALYKNGNYEEAQTYSQLALQLGTKDALKLFHAGMIALKLGDKAQASQYLQQALTINPHFSILYADEAQTTLETLQQAATK